MIPECRFMYKLRINWGKVLYRCCELRSGFILKHWRCTARSKKDCVNCKNYQPKVQNEKES